MRHTLKLFQAFCSAPKSKDIYYTFDQSQVTLCAVIKKLDSFKEQDFKHIQDLGIRRIIYSLNAEDEAMKFLSERFDTTISTLFQPQWLLKGIQFNVPVNLNELSNKVAFKALLQVSQHLQSFKTKAYKQELQIYIGLRNEAVNEVDYGKQALAIKTNFDTIENIIENSFSFKINYNIHYCDHTPLDFQFDVAIKHPTFLKSLDLDLFRYADVTQSAHEQNKLILSTAYQNNIIHYNSIFIKNYSVADKNKQKWQENKNIQEGVLSYQHLFDMLKMLHFRGSLALQYDAEYFEANVKYIQSMLKEHRYQEQERSLLTDLDERKDNVSADTLVNIS